MIEHELEKTLALGGRCVHAVLEGEQDGYTRPVTSAVTCNDECRQKLTSGSDNGVCNVFFWLLC